MTNNLKFQENFKSNRIFRCKYSYWDKLIFFETLHENFFLQNKFEFISKEVPNKKSWNFFIDYGHALTFNYIRDYSLD